MKPASITVRMYMRDYTKLRRVFAAERGESVAKYFERLAEWLKIRYDEAVVELVEKELERGDK